MGRLGGSRRPWAGRPPGESGEAAGSADPGSGQRVGQHLDGFYGGRYGEPDREGPHPADERVPQESLVGTAEVVGVVDRIWITITGVRQPIVAILLLISFFTVLSGKPVDGLLLVTVATALAWDAGMRGRRIAGLRRAEQAGDPATETGARGDGQSYGRWESRPDPRDCQASAGLADLPSPPAAESEPSAWRLRTARPGLRFIAVGVVAAVIYSLIVGSFSRYSWPATVGIVGLGTAVVTIGWGGPTRQREVPGKFSRAGMIAWGSLLVVGGIWELAALFGQPNFETSSYAHPTISTLTDPLLASMPGRALALLAWVALGAFLVER